MRTEGIIRYRTHDDPHAIDHIRIPDMDEVAPATILRHLAALSDSTEVRWVWLETRQVSEWKVSAGAELLNSKGDYRMTVAPYLDQKTFAKYKELQKAGLIEVLHSDPDTGKHAVLFGDHTEPQVMFTDALTELIAGMEGDEKPGDNKEEVVDTEHA